MKNCELQMQGIVIRSCCPSCPICDGFSGMRMIRGIGKAAESGTTVSKKLTAVLEGKLKLRMNVEKSGVGSVYIIRNLIILVFALVRLNRRIGSPTYGGVRGRGYSAPPTRLREPHCSQIVRGCW